MIKNTINYYENYLQINLSQQLVPIEESVDNMLTRLEEFESMIAMVQQETGNVIGLTGTLSQVTESKENLEQLFNNIDVLELMIAKVKQSLDGFENKVQKAEEQFDYLENNSLKKFFNPKIFKKTADVKNNATEPTVPFININEYFKQSSDN